MTSLTALDLARIKFHRFGETTHTFDCPSCGGVAWAGRAHLQCTSKECSHKVFAPLDILHLVWRSSYKECAETAASLIGRRPDYHMAQARRNARMVLDAWFDLCKGLRTPTEIMISNAFGKQGLNTTNLGNSAVIADGKRLKKFLEIAAETGASFPDQWQDDEPPTSLAYCVQSSPHTIDRIVVVNSGGTHMITWNKRRAGFSGLIDANPSVRQFLAASKDEALRLQKKLKRAGYIPHVISAFYDSHAEFGEGGWTASELPLTAVVSTTASMIDIQKAIDQFPGMEESLSATTESALVSLVPYNAAATWTHLRLTTIKRLNDNDARIVNSVAAYVFEQTGSRPDDAAYLVADFMRDGRIELAEDMRRLAENHIIYQDGTCTIRETYNSYRMANRHENRDVANFSLRLTESVIFGDANSEVYYKGVVGHGSQKTTALISRVALESAKHLQQELQVVAAAGGGVIPTIIDVGHMRGKVMPYLSAQAARLPVIRGINFLGWSADRKLFQAAGLATTMDGTKSTPAVFHPAAQPLRPFTGVGVWSDSCPEVKPDAQTLIAMMLALTVRSYKRCATRPIKIVQTSDAITLLHGLMTAMGQSHILELNSNARDTRIMNTSVTGYPCVAAGYSNQQIDQSSATYTILTDEGFRVTDEFTMQDADNAGRAAQFALVRLVEWCIATQADEFREIPSTDWHNSLMREGQWLMGHVCKLQPWEVRAKSMSDLEHVLSQIPLDKIHERMVLLNGTTLRVNCAGLDLNFDGVLKECDALGTSCTLQEQSLLIPAAPIIGAVQRFYGCDPGIKAVLG